MQLSRVEVLPLGPGVVRLNLEVPLEEVRNAVESVCKELRQRITVPGFRPSRVPAGIIKRQVGKERFEQAVMSMLIGPAFQEAVEREGLEPLTPPKFDPPSFAEDKPLQLYAEVAVKTPVQLGDYTHLPVTVPQVTVSDEDVEAALEELRSKFFTYEEAPEKVAEVGDRVRVRYAILDESTEAGGEEEWYSRVVEAGKGDWFPPIHEFVVGHRAGEVGEFEILYPDDFPNEELRSKRAKVKLEVQSVSVLRVPELDDEFARTTTGLDTLEELKESLRERKMREIERQQEGYLRRQIQDALLSCCEVVVPTLLVDAVVEQTTQTLREELEKQGSSLEVYLQRIGMKEEDYQKDARAETERLLKLRFIAEEISTREGISISDEEVEAFLESERPELPESEEEYNLIVRNARRQLLEERVMHFLLDLVRSGGAEEREQLPVEAEPTTTVEAVEGVEGVEAAETVEGMEPVEPTVQTQPAALTESTTGEEAAVPPEPATSAGTSTPTERVGRTEPTESISIVGIVDSDVDTGGGDSSC